MVLHLNKLESSSPMFVTNLVEIRPAILQMNILKFQTKLNPLQPRSLVEIGQIVLEMKIFKFRRSFFPYFIIICPWKRAAPFIWSNLNPLHPRMHYAKLKEAQWFWRICCYYLPLDNGGALHLNKLESSSLKNALCQV